MLAFETRNTHKSVRQKRQKIIFLLKVRLLRLQESLKHMDPGKVQRKWRKLKGDFADFIWDREGIANTIVTIATKRWDLWG